MKKNANVLVNKLLDEKSQEIKADNLHAKFFYVPVAIMNQDSEKLKELVKSIDINQPIIVSGIHNFDHVHYVPFFIYKNKNQLQVKNENQVQVQVICVDPSPNLSEKNTCPKKTAFEKHKKFFRNIFPNCEVNDPMVSQQIRQRDCGFNALTVLEDVYQKGAVEIENDELVIRPEKLSVNFNKMRLTIPGEGFYYSPEAIQLGKKNREKWADRLRGKKCEISIGREETSLTIDTQYSIVNCGEYSYQKNASAQYKKDTEGELLSEVASHISNDIDRARNRLLSDLNFPDIDGLVEKIKLNKELAEKVNNRGLTIPFFVSKIIENNLSNDDYSNAIIHYFKRVVESYRPKTHENIKQDMQNILNAYQTNPKVKACLDKISEHKKTEVLIQINRIADDKIIELIGDSIRKYLNEYLLNKIKNLDLNKVYSIFEDEKQLNSFIEQNKLLDEPLKEFHSLYVRKHFIKNIEFLLQPHCIQGDQRHHFFDLCEREFKRFAESANQEMKDMEFDPTLSLPKLFYYFLAECKYVMGQIDFDSFTVRMRILLCQIFNIETDQMPHLDGKVAFELDKEIMKRITHLMDHPDELKVGITYPMRRPIYVKGEETLPELNGKKLTPKLLTQFAANWMAYYSDYSKAYEDFPSQGLNRLLQALNRLPLNAREDDQLSFQWCHKYLQPILELEQQDEISQQFISALKTSASLNPFIAEKAPGELGIYSPKAATNSIEQSTQNEEKHNGSSTPTLSGGN